MKGTLPRSCRRKEKNRVFGNCRDSEAVGHFVMEPQNAPHLPPTPATPREPKNIVIYVTSKLTFVSNLNCSNVIQLRWVIVKYYTNIRKGQLLIPGLGENEDSITHQN